MARAPARATRRASPSPTAARTARRPGRPPDLRPDHRAVARRARPRQGRPFRPLARAQAACRVCQRRSARPERALGGLTKHSNSGGQRVTKAGFHRCHDRVECFAGVAEAGVVKRSTLRPQDTEPSVQAIVARVSGGDLTLDSIEGIHHPRTKGGDSSQANTATIYARLSGELPAVVLDEDIVTFPATSSRTIAGSARRRSCNPSSTPARRSSTISSSRSSRDRPLTLTGSGC